MTLALGYDESPATAYLASLSARQQKLSRVFVSVVSIASWSASSGTRPSGASADRTCLTADHVEDTRAKIWTEICPSRFVSSSGTSNSTACSKMYLEQMSVIQDDGEDVGVNGFYLKLVITA